MPAEPLATWLLEQEARALLTRLDRVQPFALQETMLPAAALSPAAQLGIEVYLLDGRRRLRRQIVSYIAWLRSDGREVSPERQQRRLTFLRLRFNLALTQLDLFSDVVTQRSEHETGVWLSGLDVAAQDALRVEGGYLRAPPIVCYLHRGLGGAIRRARTRLPGGGSNPVAVIRIPRERMIGFGIASSLVHEVGHQAAALLGLLDSLRPAIQQAGRTAPPSEAEAWRLWERWISEIVADVWSIARVGIASTMGLVSLVSLPRAFVFRISRDDPHPFAWIRVQLSCAVGEALYPDPQWRRMAHVWTTFYPPTSLPPRDLGVLRGLMATMPAFVQLVLRHRPPALHGRSLADVLRLSDREPRRLEALFDAWRSDPRTIRRTTPSLAFAVAGQARARGRLSPEEEDRMLGRLISYWALDSTLRDTARSAAASAAALNLALPTLASAGPGASFGPPRRARQPTPLRPGGRLTSRARGTRVGPRPPASRAPIVGAARAAPGSAARPR